MRETNEILEQFIASENRVFIRCSIHGKTSGIIVELKDSSIMYGCGACIMERKETGNYVYNDGLPITSFCGIPIVPTKDVEIKGDITLVDIAEAFNEGKEDD